MTHPLAIHVSRLSPGTNEETTRQAWSTTKSMCASLFGVAVEQGYVLLFFFFHIFHIYITTRVGNCT